jgi:hypothetical protein
MMTTSKPAPWVLILALLSVLVGVLVVGLAIAIPIEQVPGKTKAIWVMVVGAFGFGLGLLGFVGAIRANYTVGIMSAVLGVLLNLGAGLLGFIGFAWLWIDLKD